MAGVKGNELITLQGFPKGINNRAREEAVPSGALRAAVNVDIDNQGRTQRRSGYALAKAMPGAHSAWQHYDCDWMLVAAGNTLSALNETLDVVNTAALTRPGAPISYTLAAGRVYWSNGADMGMLTQDGTFADWTFEQPGGNPDIAPMVGVGGLEGGTYQVAVTFIHADGRESGASLASLVDVNTGDGLNLTNIPQPQSADIETVRIYRTTQNGDVLYRALDLPVGLASTLLGAQTLGRALETQFRSAIPAGHIVRFHNGRLLVAAGRFLYWSDSFNYGLTKLTENYVAFNDDITLLEPVGHAGNASCYVAAGNRTYSILGSDPKDWTRTVVGPYGAVPGASCVMDAKDIGNGQGGGLDTTGEVPVWLNTDGCIVAGLQGGLLVRLHDRDYVTAINVQRGAMAVRQVDGMKQLISTLQGGNRSGLTATDSAEAEVWKDGRRIR